MSIRNVKIKHLGRIYEGFLRVERVWGSKREGWNSLISISESPEDANEKRFIYTFNYRIPWQENSPVKTIYEAVIKDFMLNAKADLNVNEELIDEPDTEPIEVTETKPKRKRRKSKELMDE